MDTGKVDDAKKRGRGSDTTRQRVHKKLGECGQKLLRLCKQRVFEALQQALAPECADRVALVRTALHGSAAAQADPKVQGHLEGLTVRKVIVVPGRLVNIVAN